MGKEHGKFHRKEGGLRDELLRDEGVNGSGEGLLRL